MSIEKIKVRGLANISAWIFLTWGTIVFIDGLLDAFWLEPESNWFSLYKWQFVTIDQWTNYARFEMIYGACCIMIAGLLFHLKNNLPEWRERESRI